MEGFDWEAELRGGEELIWQGAPAQTLRLTWDDLPLAIVGLVSLAVGVLALFTGQWGVLAISLPFGLYFAGGQELLAAKALSSSSYALTSQRAMWVSGWPRQRLESVELRFVTTSDVVMDEDDRRLGSISFQRRAHVVGRLEPFRSAPPAFRLIEDPEPLLPIIRGEVRLGTPGEDVLALARRKQRVRTRVNRVRSSPHDR